MYYNSITCGEIDNYARILLPLFAGNPDRVKEMLFVKFGKEYSDIIEQTIKIRSQKVITVKGLRDLIDGKDVASGFLKAETDTALKNNLVIVTGRSENIIQVQGAIDGEYRATSGCEFHVTKNYNHWVLERGIMKLNYIRAIWQSQSRLTEDHQIVPWSFESNIPHEEFFTVWEGKPWCYGMIFSIEDLK